MSFTEQRRYPQCSRPGTTSSCGHHQPNYDPRIYIVAKKLAYFVLYALISSNIDRFSNLFQCKNQENICNNAVTKDPTTPQV